MDCDTAILRYCEELAPLSCQRTEILPEYCSVLYCTVLYSTVLYCTVWGWGPPIKNGGKKKKLCARGRGAVAGGGIGGGAL